MGADRFRLAAVLAASTAFVAACSSKDCRDSQGQPVTCTGGGHAGAYGAYGGGGGRDQGAVARGGFGGTGEGGGHGGGGE